MIKNERQYRITKAEAEKFSRLIGNLEANPPKGTGVPETLSLAEIAGLRSQLSDLLGELEEYDDLKAGKHVLLESVSVDDLPQTLIKARISSGQSQKQLAEFLGLKEQQIQKYEATDYAGASVSRLLQIAKALGVKTRKDVFLPTSVESFDVFKRLDQMGLEKDFILRKLIPPEIAAKARKSEGFPETDVIFHATTAASHIFGWTPEAIIGKSQLAFGSGVLGTARFKVMKRAEEKRLSAYTFYAHYLALVLLQATVELKPLPVPTDYKQVRKQIIERYGDLNLRSALRYVWDLGIPVLPLFDRGAFHGATWRVEGRNVIVLKQTTMSADRWLHDLLHELFHTGQEPENPERIVIEAAETSKERIESDEEWDATQFAADVTLDGRAEELAKMCVAATKTRQGSSGSLELLKIVVPQIAAREGVATASLANYMAFRLSLQNLDWWGAAQNLQTTDENPWEVARDVLLERTDFGRIKGMDRDLMMRALSDPED